MMVSCKKCGGPHPTWECQASVAKIAAHENRGGSSAVRAGRNEKPDAGSNPAPRSKSTAARKDVPRRDELAGPVQNQDGGSLAPQNDRAGGKVRPEPATVPEVVAGSESVTVGRVTRLEASPRSNGSQAGTQAPPVDAKSQVVALQSDGRAPSFAGVEGDANRQLTIRGTPRQRAPKGTFDRKAYQRDAAKRRRAARKAAQESK